MPQFLLNTSNKNQSPMKSYSRRNTVVDVVQSTNIATEEFKNVASVSNTANMRTYSRRKAADNISKKTNVLPIHSNSNSNSIIYSCEYCGNKSFPFSQLTMHISKACLSVDLEFVDTKSEVDERLAEISSDENIVTALDPLDSSLVIECQVEVNCNYSDLDYFLATEKSTDTESRKDFGSTQTSRNLPDFPTISSVPGLFEKPLGANYVEMSSRLSDVVSSVGFYDGTLECGDMYATGAQLNTHAKSTHTPKNLACDLCNYKCFDQSTLVQHMYSHTGAKPHLCEICGADFKKSTQLRSHHVNKHTIEKPFICQTCGDSFKLRKQLDSHEIKIHGKECGEKNFRKCPLCGLQCRPYLLSDHMNSHTGERPYSCDICLKTYRTKHTLYIHKSFHKRKNRLQDLVFKCKICGGKFISLKLLESHEIYTHNVVGTFECDICNKRFHKRAGLLMHNRKRHVPLPVIEDIDVPAGKCKCDYCGMLLKNKRRLITHFRGSHNMLLPKVTFYHSCIICKRKYSRKQALTMHQITKHVVRSGRVEVVRLTCTQCKKSYASASSLYQHVRGIHKKLATSYRCPRCDTVLSSSIALANHMVIHDDVKPF